MPPKQRFLSFLPLWIPVKATRGSPHLLWNADSLVFRSAGRKTSSGYAPAAPAKSSSIIARCPGRTFWERLGKDTRFQLKYSTKDGLGYRPKWSGSPEGLCSMVYNMLKRGNNLGNQLPNSRLSS